MLPPFLYSQAHKKFIWVPGGGVVSSKHSWLHSCLRSVDLCKSVVCCKVWVVFFFVCVKGDYPVMKPGAEYSWTSCTTFQTTHGSMRGHFTMTNLQTGWYSSAVLCVCQSCTHTIHTANRLSTLGSGKFWYLFFFVFLNNCVPSRKIPCTYQYFLFVSLCFVQLQFVNSCHFALTSFFPAYWSCFACNTHLHLILYSSHYNGVVHFSGSCFEHLPVARLVVWTWTGPCYRKMTLRGGCQSGGLTNSIMMFAQFPLWGLHCVCVWGGG